MMFAIASAFTVLALTSDAKPSPSLTHHRQKTQWQCKHNDNYHGDQSDYGYTDEKCQYSYCLNGSADPTKYPAR
eukprot:Pgem_evm1s13738